MATSSAERQRAFKQRMYDAGYKQTIVWALREPEKKGPRMDKGAFLRKLERLTGQYTAEEQGRLYGELIRYIETKKGVTKEKKA
ncbi:MAG: hypothetical protein LBQ35_06105 [Spirochaetaceae bacterium]|jgi:hypothetical protein|nr:hypothetical protein [Spirochaetaceae bacterium]